MSQEVYRDFHFGGRQKVLIYTEQEMADALGISVKQLHQAVETGHIGYAWKHEGKWEWNQVSYDKTVRMWWCVTHGGHKFQDEGPYTLPEERVQKHKHICLHCGTMRYD